MGKKEQRGQHFLAVAKKNKEDVYRYFRLFPDATQKECAKHLHLSLPTVAKYQGMYFDKEVQE